MAKIDKYVAFVKKQVGVQQKLAVKYEESPFRKGQHLDSAKNFSELAEFLCEIQKKGTADTAYLHRGEHQYVLCRAPEPDHAYVNAALHPPDQRVQQEI